MDDTPGRGDALFQVERLYWCLDKFVAHMQAMFAFLRERRQNLFDVGFEVLLYDLACTYFECEPTEHGERCFGDSRDKRLDSVSVVIALSVTAEGFRCSWRCHALYWSRQEAQQRITRTNEMVKGPLWRGCLRRCTRSQEKAPLNSGAL
jgi:hypothetical protein